MRPMDDVWSDISSLRSPTTNHFQNFFPRPPETTTTATTSSFHPPPSTTTILTLLTTTATATTSDEQVVDVDPNKRRKPNPPPCNFTSATASQPEYSEKFRRLMKNREAAARSRARKQARADELEHEVMRLAKENAKLKRMQKQVHVSQVPKDAKHKLNRTKSAPF